jgi:hypothetical protein|tara:strand:- start:348 stop:653 length:306 start_codon:yes stop_codon:yes gene_type:complete
MKTNELKKGARVQLRNGWQAIIWDNKKGNTRMAKVFGQYEELGSVYAHDVVAYFAPPSEGEPPALKDKKAEVGYLLREGYDVHEIEHTPAQLSLSRAVSFL